MVISRTNIVSGIFIWILCLFSCLSIEASIDRTSFGSPETLFEIDTSLGTMMVYRPTSEEVHRTAPIAKAIFVEAFSTTYTEYHRQSGSIEPVEKWLRLREGLTLESWLDGVFEEEYEEYLALKKAFIYLCNSNADLIGWLSYSPMSEKREIYLSQCSLEADSRNHKIATKAFSKVLKEGFVKKLFPEAKEVKLIARKINTIAHHLYINAGFTRDETIDPSVYGDSYDDRYVGFRLLLE